MLSHYIPTDEDEDDKDKDEDEDVNAKDDESKDIKWLEDKTYLMVRYMGITNKIIKKIEGRVKSHIQS